MAVHWDRKRTIRGLLLSVLWVAAVSVLWYPGCGEVVSSRVPGVYTIRKFGALGYYRVRVGPKIPYFEGFDSEGLLPTIGGSVLVSTACLWEWRRTPRRKAPGLVDGDLSSG
jgi:hypothetical protein